VTVHELQGRFPRPEPTDLDRAGRLLAELPDKSAVLIDGLALGAMPRQVARHADRLRMVALVHHPLRDETGLDAGTAGALEQSEGEALASARRVVVTSRATWRRVSDLYGLSPNRISVVEPGTDPAPLARGSGGSAVEMLSVANLIPRKGYDVLFRALLRMTGTTGRRWTLTCVGSADHDPATAEQLRAQVVASGLGDRVRLAGEMDGPCLAESYNRADLFVLATWHEGYGMAVAEALARGLPVVSTRTGAIPDLVGPRAGLLVEPGDEQALAVALGRVIGDPRLRERLAEGACEVRERLPTWEGAADKMAAVLSGT
jgi:glycosyltransferase involved in cell wall biosynthesis